MRRALELLGCLALGLLVAAAMWLSVMHSGGEGP